MRKFLFILLAVIATACSFTVTIQPDISWDLDPVTMTASVTAEPSEVATITATSTVQPSSTVSPTVTETATSIPTLDPTPTQEILTNNIIRLSANTNIRNAPNGAVVRVAMAQSQLTVVERDGDWLRIDSPSSEWLFNGSWVTFIQGSLGNVPVSQARAQSRLGYNTLEVYDEAYYLAHLERLCPAFMLVMDNLGLADRVYQRLHEPCGTEVIHRSWHPADGSEYLIRTAQDFVSQWQREGYPHLIRYTTNEVSCSGTNCERYVAQEVEIAKLAREAGYTVVLGNTGVGKYSPNDVTNGVYNPLVRAALEYGQYLGFHEYTGLCLCFGFGQMPSSHLGQPALMQPALWRTDVQFDFAPFVIQGVDGELPFGQEMMDTYYAAAMMADAFAQAACGELPAYWHMGRSFWILLWYECTTGDARVPTVVMTEWGWDRLDDISSVVNPLQSQFGIPEFDNNLRGWRSLARVWQWYWADWSIAEAAYYQIDYATALYPDNYYFLLFAWSDNKNRDWTRAGFSYGNYGDGAALELHDYLEAAS